MRTCSSMIICAAVSALGFLRPQIPCDLNCYLFNLIKYQFLCLIFMQGWLKCFFLHNVSSARTPLPNYIQLLLCFSPPTRFQFCGRQRPFFFLSFLGSCMDEYRENTDNNRGKEQLTLLHKTSWFAPFSLK